jgi:predicted metallopeptidase
MRVWGCHHVIYNVAEIEPFLQELMKQLQERLKSSKNEYQERMNVIAHELKKVELTRTKLHEGVEKGLSSG